MNIKDITNFKDLNLHQTFRAHIIYEQIMGETFGSNQGLIGIITFFYANVIASNKEWDLDYDEFMDWLDERPQMLEEFAQWYMRINHVQAPDGGESKNV